MNSSCNFLLAAYAESHGFPQNSLWIYMLSCADEIASLGLFNGMTQFFR